MTVRQQMRETMNSRWQTRRRRRLVFIVGRFVVLLSVLALIGWWSGGGRWMLGFIAFAGLMLAFRLALFYVNGRRFHRGSAQQREGVAPRLPHA